MKNLSIYVIFFNVVWIVGQYIIEPTHNGLPSNEYCLLPPSLISYPFEKLFFWWMLHNQQGCHYIMFHIKNPRLIYTQSFWTNKFFYLITTSLKHLIYFDHLHSGLFDSEITRSFKQPLSHFSLISRNDMKGNGKMCFRLMFMTDKQTVWKPNKKRMMKTLEEW